MAAGSSSEEVTLVKTRAGAGVRERQSWQHGAWSRPPMSSSGNFAVTTIECGAYAELRSLDKFFFRKAFCGFE